MDSPILIDEKNLDIQRITEMLNGIKIFEPNNKEKIWYALLRKLPTELSTILLAQLIYGNTINSIQNANWPQNGSIIVCLNSHLTNYASKKFYLAKYRLVNDPHYWYEEVSQIKDGIEYLIIT